jgi:beta-xylosidase
MKLLRVWRGPALVALLALLIPVVAASGSTAGAAATKTFSNPVYKNNFPDPFILRVGKVYYAYGTGNDLASIQELHSTDLIHWKSGKDAMPHTAKWVNGSTWAPEVLRRKDGTYVMYYTGHDIGSDKQCVGHAVSKSPSGKFVDSASKPFVCQPALGGSIDSDVFRDSNGKLYLTWKSDGNCCNLTTWIFAQQLSSDGMKLVGKAAKLEHNDVDWEGGVTEAPTMWKHGKSYFLFYTGNDYGSSKYAVGYATCKSPLGPCEDAPDNPILKSACKAAGPGHEAIITDSRGQDWMVYHAWPSNHIGDNTGGPGRQLWLDRLDWKDGKPVVHGPTCTKQTDPVVTG